MWKIVTCLFCAGVLVAQAGCSEEVAEPSQRDGLVTVIGNVARIVDDTPVDGNARVDVDLDGGGQEILYLPSFFGNPPTEEEKKVYQVIIELEVGDRVEAMGKKTEYGVKLKRLKKL